MSRLSEIRTRQAEIRTALDALEALAEPTQDDHDRADVLLEEWDTLTEEAKPFIEREERLAAVRATMQEERNRTSGFSAPDVHIKRNTDPYADMDSVRQGLVAPSELRARSLDAIERFNKRNDQFHLGHDGAEQAAKLVERSGRKFSNDLSRHILTTSTPEYVASFESYMNDPMGYGARAAMSLTNANGGYLVPFTLDPTIILTNAGSANPYRSVATIKQTMTNNWNGVTSAGVNAEWTAEGTEAADASPTVGQLEITPIKADAYVFGSYEVLEDSDFAQQFPRLLSDAKDRLEEHAFAVGTGTTQPYGVVTRGTAFTQGSAAANIVAADVYALQAQLPARFRGPGSHPVFLANLTTINHLRTLAKASGLTGATLVVDGPNGSNILGYPVLESTSISGTVATGSKNLVYMDGDEFYIVDRVGMSVLYEPNVIGTNHRSTGQGAFYAHWRVGSDVSTATAVQVLTLGA